MLKDSSTSNTRERKTFRKESDLFTVSEYLNNCPPEKDRYTLLWTNIIICMSASIYIIYTLLYIYSSERDQLESSMYKTSPTQRVLLRPFLLLSSFGSFLLVRGRKDELPFSHICICIETFRPRDIFVYRFFFETSPSTFVEHMHALDSLWTFSPAYPRTMGTILCCEFTNVPFFLYSGRSFSGFLSVSKQRRVVSGLRLPVNPLSFRIELFCVTLSDM